MDCISLRRVAGSTRWMGALALFLTLGLASGSQALSLLDLDAGHSFASGDGSLLFAFDPGSITLAGSLASDLSLYVVDVLSQGFQIRGPLAVADGATGLLFADYRVKATAGLLGGAGLESQLAVRGATALALLAVDVGGLGNLLNAATGGGLLLPSDVLAAAGPAGTTVRTALSLQTNAPGQLASLVAFVQTFELSIPEPSQSLLLLAGMLGLAAMGGSERRNP